MIITRDHMSYETLLLKCHMRAEERTSFLNIFSILSEGRLYVKKVQCLQ